MNEEDPDIVYGTREDTNVVMSERVQNLASSIYKEFERMIQTYDEDVVKELMPLVVGILESLDQSCKEKQENEVDLELLRDDNEQLLTQYEREKQLRKASEQKCLELEDTVEEERKQLQAQVEGLESNVRMFELKAKNAQDHIARLEEKESEMKKEYTKLHDRYTELFKTHMDYMERTKLLMGADRIMDSGTSPKSGKSGFQLPILRSVNPSIYSEGNTPIKSGTTPPNEYEILSPGGRSSDSNVSLKHELRGQGKSKTQTSEMGQITDNLDMRETSTATSASTKAECPESREVPNDSENNNSISQDVAEESTDMVDNEPLDPGYAEIITSPDMEDIDDSGFEPSKSTPMAEPRKNNESSIFDELSRQDLGEIDDGMDITVSDNFFGMSKEVENLILENTELLATKNALNVVKDDLIAKVDELSRKRFHDYEEYIPEPLRSEQEILREEIASLQASKDKLKKRVTELEEELKKSREEMEKMKEKATQGEEGEEDIPMAQRKRFTRVEMARVLMERNQYKERLMELQEAVRWTEMIRASREHPDLAQPKPKKGNIWNFFSGLVGGGSSGSSDPPAPSAAPQTPSGPPVRQSSSTTTTPKKSKTMII